MRITVMVGLILALVVAYASDKVIHDSPQAAAEAFLSLIDQGNYQESWSEASQLLRDNVDAEQWAEHAGSFRKPLGIVDSRKLDSIEYQDSLDDMPVGDYAFVIFNSALADGGSTSEMVGLMLDDEATWRVIGYQTLLAQKPLYFVGYQRPLLADRRINWTKKTRRCWFCFQAASGKTMYEQAISASDSMPERKKPAQFRAAQHSVVNTPCCSPLFNHECIEPGPFRFLKTQDGQSIGPAFHG